MKNYLTEFLGTYFLVLTIGLNAVQEVPMGPLAIGCAMMVMVYMGGHVSGGHYNPAVSLAVMLRGKLSPIQFVPYVVAQVAGAFAAAVAVAYLLDGKTFAPAPGKGVTPIQALVVEILFTFALCLVVLNVATSAKTTGNSFYGLAIGFTVVVGTFAGGGISGGAYNPAVGCGPAIIKSLWGSEGDPSPLTNVWIHTVGPFVGGILAAVVSLVQEEPEPSR